MSFGKVDEAWYGKLRKSKLTPPNFVFAPVWTILYILMGVSGYLYFTHKPSYFGIALFVIQLGLNLAWSPVFFTLKKPCLSLGIILALVFFMAMTIIEFQKTNPKAAYLLVPTLIWIMFASYLNLFVCHYN